MTVAPASTDVARAAVHTAVKNLILRGSLRAGQKLVTDELAKRLGVSRMPVRETLERLQQEGFVVHVPHRGCFVAEITAEEARDLYGVREALEVHALRQTAAKGLTAAHLARLKAVLDTYATLVRDNVMRQRLQVDRDFHLTLAAIPGNQALLTMLQSVYERIFLKIRTEGYGVPRGAEGYEEHVLLFKALEAADFAKAEHMLTAHIRLGCDRLLAHIDAGGDSSVSPLPTRPR
ncbi:MAG: GntR family transcriptional regulator [Dehalococcoidia bacterium]